MRDSRSKKDVWTRKQFAGYDGIFSSKRKRPLAEYRKAGRGARASFLYGFTSAGSHPGSFLATPPKGMGF
jgi:hypothetical protein